MKVKDKITGIICDSERFSNYNLEEIEIIFPDKSIDKVHISEYDIELKSGYKDMQTALRDGDILLTKDSRIFFESNKSLKPKECPFNIFFESDIKPCDSSCKLNIEEECALVILANFIKTNVLEQLTLALNNFPRDHNIPDEIRVRY